MKQHYKVDVFVDEQAVRSLQPGTPATVELYGSSSQVLQGKVSLVRSGVGRLSAGEDVAVPSLCEQNRQLVTMLYSDMTWWKQRKQPGNLDVFFALLASFLNLTPLRSKYGRSSGIG